MQGVHEVFAQERFIDDRGPSWLQLLFMLPSEIVTHTNVQRADVDWLVVR